MVKVLNFPSLKIKSQVFHVPGNVIDGGYTAGGARVMSPEPGGRSTLEVQLSLSVTEWETPWVSWLMSKLNGEIFRIQLAKTPQIARTLPNDAQISVVPWDETGLMPISAWDNGRFWAADGESLSISQTSLIGSSYIYLEDIGPLRVGHVIGIGDVTYLIDEISDDGLTVIKPPLRQTVFSGESVYLTPYFTGTIDSSSDFVQGYDSEFMGHIRPGKLIFKESIL
jgi:hypothetical protein